MSSAILTIDDVASKNTTAIVDYLCSKNIRAVMFGVGECIEKYYTEALYAIKKGMIVGNHSYTHPAFSSLSMDECKNQIEHTEDVLDRLYSEARVERTIRPFRFPYGDKGGDKKEALQSYLKDKGFNKLCDTGITYPWWKSQGLDKDIDTYWTFDFAEYNIREDSGFTIDDVWKRVNDETPSCGGYLFDKDSHHIILLHAHDETERLVPEYYRQLIDYVLEKGIRFEDPLF